MIQTIFTDIAHYIYLFRQTDILMMAVCLCLLFNIIRKSFRKKSRMTAGSISGIYSTETRVMLACYMIVIVQLTLICRESGTRDAISLTFFGTYYPSVRAVAYMLENLLLFIPYGILLPNAFKACKKPWVTLLIGFLSSLAIEVTQLITKRGYFQVDDIWLNTLGALVGWFIYFLSVKIGALTFVSGTIFIVLLLMIFSFSAQEGAESSSLSDIFAKFFAGVYNHLSGKNIDYELFVFPVRKGAHMTEYAALFADTYVLIYSIAGRCIAWLAFVIAALAASLDEFHQLYVPGRTGQLRDVLIDLLGAFISFLIILLIKHIRKKHRPGSAG
ncbi:MAG: VanZ family protein [Lachnospiraceae bacterium]|jgi:glycopeptide antibiotics resistance protein|nr:VanZ family protein [Lachnospiraceae bacterium]MEE3460654.1 VanZ family protein [Lachnospiraceae bacterium]